MQWVSCRVQANGEAGTTRPGSVTVGYGFGNLPLVSYVHHLLEQSIPLATSHLQGAHENHQHLAEADSIWGEA